MVVMAGFGPRGTEEIAALLLELDDASVIPLTESIYVQGSGLASCLLVRRARVSL
jgi:hypothetical protein